MSIRELLSFDPETDQLRWREAPPEQDVREGLACREKVRVGSAWNRARGRNNTSGFTGVRLHKPSGRWQARITRLGKTRSLGYFDTALEAWRARAASEEAWRASL